MDEKGQGEIKFGLILTGIVIGGLLVFGAVKTAIQTSNFDREFKIGSIQIIANLISLGETGSPSISDLPEWIPASGVRKVFDRPREFWIKKCESFSFDGEAIGVFASTNFPHPELVEIILPPNPSGMINVCVPDGVRIRVILWAKY
jgi:hypothetical protein